MNFGSGRIRLGLGSLAASPLPSSKESRSNVLRPSIVFLLSMLAFSLTPPSSGYAATLTVCNNGCGYNTIAAAVSAASAGDTISITDGGHTESKITVDRSLTIQGQGASNTTIDGGSAIYGSAAGSVFVVNSSVTAKIQDLTISGGQACNYPFVSSGGGVLNYGTVTITNSTLSGNAACDTGGGIATLGGTLTVNNSTIADNFAITGGGIGNILGGIVTISNSTLSRNRVQDRGGAFYQYSSTATISNSTFSGNFSGSTGGGLENSPYGSLTMINSTISGNSAGNVGGGVFNYGTTLMISFTTIAGNSAPAYSGNYGEFWEDPNATDKFYGFSPIIKNSIVGLVPNLGALALNAPGTTETMALLPGSANIDAAVDCTDAFGNPVTTDQRGVPRPQGPACDVGAYEYGYTLPDTTPPAISLVAPTATTYLLNKSIVASYTCTDPDDAVSLCSGTVASGANIDTASVGVKTFTVNTADSHSNSVSQSVNYNVAYNICTDYDTSHSKKSGSTVPIKLTICDVSGANQSDSTIVLHATAVIMVSNSDTEPLVDSGNANPDDDFRFIAGPEYIFNLSTSGYPAGKFALQFTVSGDPTTHSALFQLK